MEGITFAAVRKAKSNCHKKADAKHRPIPYLLILKFLVNLIGSKNSIPDPNPDDLFTYINNICLIPCMVLEIRQSDSYAVAFLKHMHQGF